MEFVKICCSWSYCSSECLFRDVFGCLGFWGVWLYFGEWWNSWQWDIVTNVGHWEIVSNTHIYTHNLEYVYTYLYIYMNVYRYIYIYIYVYLHICVCMCIHTYVPFLCIYMHRWLVYNCSCEKFCMFASDIWVCMYVYTNVYTHTYVDIYIYIFTCINLHTYIHIHIYTYMYIHIYTCIWVYIYTYPDAFSTMEEQEIACDSQLYTLIYYTHTYVYMYIFTFIYSHI